MADQSQPASGPSGWRPLHPGAHSFFENLPEQGNMFRVYLPRCGPEQVASSPAGTEANT